MTNGIFYRAKRKAYFRPRQKKRRFFWRGAKTFLKLSAFLFVFGALGGVAAFAYFAKDLPDPAKISERQIIQSTKIYDRTGKIILYDIHGEEKRTVVPFDQISQFIKDATIATEDANFYNHFGLDFKGTARAALGVLTGNKSTGGGSTITQQFIKKSFFSDQRSYLRKIKEWILAIELERKYSKNEILGFYLNQIPYGSNAYGVEAAAQTFFGKTANNLDLSESALLAGLPQSPSRLSPFGSHPEELKARQAYILDRMTGLGYISREQAQTAKDKKLKFAAQSHGIKAPHFVMFVKEYLENKYGQDYIEKAGLKVTTTLDWELQQAAEKIVSETADANWKKYRAYNAALAAIDPKSGQILTMVGSRDYFDIEHDGNVNVTVRDRQPGSSFKPFAYVTAFEKGYTADTVLFDLKTEFNPNCPADGNGLRDNYGLACYNPGNYDDKFRGPVTARQALAQSLNIPAVKMLYLAGIPATIKTAKDMGITSLNDPNRYGLSLVLGGGEVKLLDHTASYGVFAAEGKKYEKTPILKIADGAGNALEEYKPESQNVLAPQYARLISDILSDNAARTPIFGSNSALYFPDRPVAAKTGTTEAYRDAWTMGYTPSLAVGVWVGNNDNGSMARSGAGIAAAGPIWHNFIKTAYQLKAAGNCDSANNNFCLPQEIEQFTKPEPTQANKDILNGSYIASRVVRVDRISGQLATDQTPPELIEERPLKEVHDILYYAQKDKPQGAAPQNPASDPQFANWEAAVSNWLSQQGGQFNLSPPIGSDSLHTTANLPKIKIISPVANQTISQPRFDVMVEATAPLGLKQVDYFLNDEFTGSSLVAPFQATITVPSSILNNSATQPVVLKARAFDAVFNRQEDQISIFIVPLPMLPDVEMLSPPTLR